MGITFVVIIVAVLAIANGVALYLFLKGKPAEAPKTDDVAMKLLLEQMNDMRRTVDQKMGETHRTVNESMKSQFSQSQKLIKDFQQDVNSMIEKVTRVEETGKQMVGFADQLQSLQDMLKNPKQRGVLGEYYLETLLKNAMAPKDYEMQYKFRDGEIVDAIVRIKNKILPIDSKFSLENYNRMIGEKNDTEKDRLKKMFVNDLKLRIKETSKYIRPDEGTMDFAFMFIPHEAIYYDLLVNTVGALGAGDENTENLIQRSVKEYKVVIVSPTSFLAYLQTVMQGLKAMEIEEQAKSIVQRVGELGKHLKAYEEHHGKLGAALSTVVNKYNLSNAELKKVDKDVVRITGGSAGIVGSGLLEKPEIDE